MVAGEATQRGQFQHALRWPPPIPLTKYKPRFTSQPEDLQRHQTPVLHSQAGWSSHQDSQGAEGDTEQGTRGGSRTWEQGAEGAEEQEAVEPSEEREHQAGYNTSIGQPTRGTFMNSQNNVFSGPSARPGEAYGPP